MAHVVEGVEAEVPSYAFRFASKRVTAWMNGETWELTRGTDFPREMGLDILRHRLRAAMVYRMEMGTLPPSLLAVWENPDGRTFVKVTPRD